MDISNYVAIHSSLFSFILLHSYCLQPSSFGYTPPKKYFINCGSDAEVTINGRIFIGDVNFQRGSGDGDGDGYSFFVDKGDTVKNANAPSNASPLYRTARFYTTTFSYELQIPKNGTYLVRLHYYPFFSSPMNLSSAIFNVSAVGFLLQSNFRVPSGDALPLIKEFFLTLNIGKFIIYFTPHSASFAFVNALEVFVGFEDKSFIAARKPRLLIPEGRSIIYYGLLSQVISTIYRLNVGGAEITPENDTLWRTWVPDDEYLINRSAAMNSDVYNYKPSYITGGSTEFIAPDLIYQTAKEINNAKSLNITWQFAVTKNRKHFVRAHFCDIISLSLNVITFMIYIYNQFGMKIAPSNEFQQLATPFYFDFVVDSDDSGFMNISIAPWVNSTLKNAFLNGLEIMELTKESTFLPSQSKPGKNKFLFIIGFSIGGLVIVCFLLILLKHCKARTNELKSSLSNSIERSSCSNGIPDLSLGLKIPLSEILEATNKFNKKLIVGEGGFGKVYKGVLRNGNTVAVKRSEPKHGQGFQEFRSEVLVLSRIRHCHLVSLIGYCDEWPEMIIVCEFMEKGTLRDHLYHSKSSKKFPLSWEQRLEICIGSARGLHYLHSSSGIIHRDVKSTNILLDEHFKSKVSDFGLSRSFPPDQTHVSTDVKGSIGYIDPEYFRCLQLTDKSDVYSFGVVLLEVICARPAVDNSLPREQGNLAEWGLYWQNKGELEKIIDLSLVGMINKDSLMKFGETFVKCLKECGSQRSCMRDVLWDLEYTLRLQQMGTHIERPENASRRFLNEDLGEVLDGDESEALSLKRG